ncbi:MAG: hypothetical protein HY443_00995, partial [Candidatus Nealsonbacteria bacterium]|nr:hypothetical protein [Candidatus Nealsonbacteria bacterium]
ADTYLMSINQEVGKSLKSEGSTAIVKRVWKKNGAIFSSVNNSNPSSQIQGTIIELTAEDNVGRQASQSYDVRTQLPVPEWQEISPF